MKLYIIRHGETNENATGIIQGWIDTRLNDKGIAQAVEIADNFTMAVDALYSSDLQRATRTAQEFRVRHASIPYFEDARLRERDFGVIAGTKKDRRDWEQYWSTKDLDPSIGAETVEQFTERVRGFLDDMKRSGFESVLVIAHAGVLNRVQAVIDPRHLYVPYDNATILTFDI